MSADPSIAQVRRFNRTVTQRVGALSDRYLWRDRTLGASRVLWEIGSEGCEVRSLRARLELDSGQMSRLLRPPAGAFIVAYLRDEPIGCGALKHHRSEPSEIKRMWVAESARGLGIGRRLLAALEQVARDARAPAVRLDTNKTLIEAISMYRSAGYQEIPRFNSEPFAHHWFEK